jgi:hypothetical protein
MALFGLGKGGRHADRKATEDFLTDWVAGRHGVEVYVEPKTAVTGVSMLLVAHDGEFTRRLVGSPEKAKAFAREHALPIYDATMIGYPQRMRDYSRRKTILAQRDERNRLDS